MRGKNYPGRPFEAGKLEVKAIITCHRCKKVWKSPRASHKRFHFHSRFLKALLLPTMLLPVLSLISSDAVGQPCMEDIPHPSPKAIPCGQCSVLSCQQEKEAKPKGMKKVQVSNTTTQCFAATRRGFGCSLKLIQMSAALPTTTTMLSDELCRSADKQLTQQRAPTGPAAAQKGNGANMASILWFITTSSFAGAN